MLQKEVLMDQQKRPVLIRFETRKEAVDLYVRIELKYFLAKLLFSRLNPEV